MISGGDLSIGKLFGPVLLAASETPGAVTREKSTSEQSQLLDGDINAAVTTAKERNCGLWCTDEEYAARVKPLATPRLMQQIFETGRCASIDTDLDNATDTSWDKDDRKLNGSIRVGLATYCAQQADKVVCEEEKQSLKTEAENQCKAKVASAETTSSTITDVISRTSSDTARKVAKEVAKEGREKSPPPYTYNPLLRLTPQQSQERVPPLTPAQEEPSAVEESAPIATPEKQPEAPPAESKPEAPKEAPKEKPKKERPKVIPYK